MEGLKRARGWRGNKQGVFDQLGSLGVVPVITINDAKHAEPLCRALNDGGINCIEITFRTAAAKQAIKNAAAANIPGMLIGAGTVLSVAQAEEAVAAGAAFVVAPGLNADVVNWCKDNNIPMIPGIMTATEIEHALRLGLSYAKFFPAEPAGGLKLLKAMSAPYGDAIRFMPTGGITTKNLEEYLAFKGVLCCGGSWIATTADIENEEWAKITANAAEAVKLASSGVTASASASGTEAGSGSVQPSGKRKKI